MNKLKDIFRQERCAIPAKIILVYICWKIFYYIISIDHTSVHSCWIYFTKSAGSIYAAVASTILSAVGIPAFHRDYAIILIPSGKQVRVAEHCLAIPAMVIFTAAVLIFRGKFLSKILFIPVGIAGIVIINICRLLLVSYAFLNYGPFFFMLHHSIIYVVLTYGFIFYMMKKWIDHTQGGVHSISKV